MAKIDELVDRFIDLRDQVSHKTKKLKDFKAKCKVEQDSIELELIAFSEELGVNSFATASGTAFRTEKTYAKMLSGTKRIEYAIESGDFSLFTSHINKLHAIELAENGIGEDVTGVVIERETVIQIRKGTK